MYISKQPFHKFKQPFHKSKQTFHKSKQTFLNRGIGITFDDMYSK